MSIDAKKNLLICSTADCAHLAPQIAALCANFCGTTSVAADAKSTPKLDTFERIYLAGNIAHIRQLHDLKQAAALVIRELSINHADPADQKDQKNQKAHADQAGGWASVSIGCVPRLVHGMGVYYPSLFETSHFAALKGDHSFLALTESNKPNSALRSGVYLSDVTQRADGKASDGKAAEFEYNLLRCSTNLGGPTENFSATDRGIIGLVQSAVKDTFADAAPVNHVLAQIYEHKGTKKAKISAHSDKTKDMPPNGVIAFCTFYDKKCASKECYTKLCFKAKAPALLRDPGLVKEFTVALEPNSVFIIPLSTNRLYTHEIQASYLNAEKLPTRLGYVCRCSATRAKFIDGATMVERDGKYLPLTVATAQEVKKLKELYAAENTTIEPVPYGFTGFSLNAGDYLAPKI